MSNVSKRHLNALAYAIEKNKAWEAGAGSPEWIGTTNDFSDDTGIIKAPKNLHLTFQRKQEELAQIRAGWQEASVQLFARAVEMSNSWGAPRGDPKWTILARHWQLWTGQTATNDLAYATYLANIVQLEVIRAEAQQPASQNPTQEEPASCPHCKHMKATVEALVDRIAKIEAQLEGQQMTD